MNISQAFNGIINFQIPVEVWWAVGIIIFIIIVLNICMKLNP
jgi:hypothetical protein